MVGTRAIAIGKAQPFENRTVINPIFKNSNFKMFSDFEWVEDNLTPGKNNWSIFHATFLHKFMTLGYTNYQSLAAVSIISSVGSIIGWMVVWVGRTGFVA